MKIFSFLIFVASLINATHIHSADIDHKDSWLGGILKYATSKNLTRSQSPTKTIRMSMSIVRVKIFLQITGQKNMINWLIMIMKTAIMKELIMETILMKNFMMIITILKRPSKIQNQAGVSIPPRLQAWVSQKTKCSPIHITSDLMVHKLWRIMTLQILSEFDRIF